MKRTSKALARMGVGAVTVATLLAMPFAIGSASADPPAFPATGLTTTPGTVNDGTAFTTCPADARAPGAAYGTKTIVATPQTGNNGGQAIFCVFLQGAASIGQTVTLNVAGGTSAYFPTAQGTGTVQTSATTATCTTVTTGAGGNSYCQVDVADTKAEGATVTATNGVNTASQPVNFDGLSWDPCSVTGINTTANCTFQGTVNTQTPITLHYAAGGAGAQTKLINLQLGGSAVFSASQPTNVQIVDSTHARCTTDATGSCAPNILDAASETVTLLAYITPTNANPYPGDGAAVPASGDLDSAAISLTFGAASVAPGELDLIKTTLVTPQGQTAALAEPGDVIQNQYQLRGAPLQQGQGACANPQCPGTILANTTLTLKVSNGFFTPNCVFPASTSPASLGNNTYANCSFNTAPANAAKTGDIKSSGQSIDTKTDASGMVVVSLGIAKDAGFDDNGLVTATVTSGSLASQVSGNANLPTSTTCAGSVTPIQPTTGGAISPPTAVAPAPGSYSGCDIDVEWTTKEAPLNGDTAKDVVIPAIRNPNNNFISQENNYTATDTGTNNVPDVSRVVFLVHLTDQFGNLTSNAGAPIASAAGIEKTGVGNLVECDGFSAIDACSLAGTPQDPIFGVTQPDGTVTQDALALGSYTNNDSAVQDRFEADANTAVSDEVVNCYPDDCSDNVGPDHTSGNPGVNDGTQTDTTGWFPETTLFSGVVAGTAATPAASNYTEGAAATPSVDTLTINFYNQLAQAVVTFSVKPGHKVPTSTAVTVASTVSDQFKNPIVDADLQFIRSGANEASCTPIQNGGGIDPNSEVFTNQAGKGGYTFSCNQPGASAVNVVVTGPGGTQLAAGKEVIHFTGSSAHLTKEKPKLKLHANGHKVTLKVKTHPAVHGKTVNFYKINKHGISKLFGQDKTSKSGVAKLHVHLKSGKYHFEAKVQGLKGTKYNSKFSKTKKLVV